MDEEAPCVPADDGFPAPNWGDPMSPQAAYLVGKYLQEAPGARRVDRKRKQAERAARKAARRQKKHMRRKG